MAILIMGFTEGASSYLVDLGPSYTEIANESVNFIISTRFSLLVEPTGLTWTVGLSSAKCAGSLPIGSMVNNWYHPDTSTVWTTNNTTINFSPTQSVKVQPFSAGEHYFLFNALFKSWSSTAHVMKVHVTVSASAAPVVNSCIIEPYTRACGGSFAQQDITGSVTVTEV